MRSRNLFIQKIFFIFLSSTALCAQAAEYTNSIGMNFIEIKTGCFMMGRDAKFEEGDDDELPRHEVCIKKDFYLGKTEVTQEQWVAVMDKNPSKFKGRSSPVEKVKWKDAQEFIRRLNEKEGGNHYRLPTESEWEYACRAGSTSDYYFGDYDRFLPEYGWFRGNSNKRTHPVAQKKPNPWGLYDMHGNVWEWVEDCYHETKYSSEAPKDGSAWNSSCYYFVGGEISGMVRGGSWFNDSKNLRSANRRSYPKDSKDSNVGFRVVRIP